MTAESLLAAYSAWLLAWMVPLWLLSFLYRSIVRTIACPEQSREDSVVAAVPAPPARLPRIHLTAA